MVDGVRVAITGNSMVDARILLYAADQQALLGQHGRHRHLQQNSIGRRNSSHNTEIIHLRGGASALSRGGGGQDSDLPSAGCSSLWRQVLQHHKAVVSETKLTFGNSTYSRKYPLLRHGGVLACLAVIGDQ